MAITLEQFRAAARRVDDVQEATGVDLGYPSKCPGIVYTADLHIFDCGDNAIGGRYCLQIYGDEWQSDDLAGLESRLYSWAVHEFGCAD